VNGSPGSLRRRIAHIPLIYGRSVYRPLPGLGGFLAASCLLVASILTLGLLDNAPPAAFRLSYAAPPLSSVLWFAGLAASLAGAVIAGYLVRDRQHPPVEAITVAERARVARELHDGVIQSLIGLEMQVDVWRREGGEETAVSRLGHIQAVLRKETLDLRDLIQHMKPPSIDASQILDYLAELVARFEQQSGIAAHFVSEVDELTLSPHVCSEIARIVQEALVNVRKHSGAHTVLVRVSAPKGYWKFEIDDDGRGFGFMGRHSHADLEVGRKGPVVIKERVRAIGARLAVESAPGQGARVEVWLPRETNGPNG
jgi:signal transduction histidine kinase